MRGALLLTLGVLLATVVATGTTVAAPKAETATATTEAVDLNSATATELETIPGIGPALAKRIVEFRDEHGPFDRVDDLLKVRGIGEKSLDKLRPHLRVAKPR
jgi:competence protein ComEA